MFVTGTGVLSNKTIFEVARDPGTLMAPCECHCGGSGRTEGPCCAAQSCCPATGFLCPPCGTVSGCCFVPSHHVPPPKITDTHLLKQRTLGTGPAFELAVFKVGATAQVGPAPRGSDSARKVCRA